MVASAISAYLARERRRKLENPIAGLSRTHTFSSPEFSGRFASYNATLTAGNAVTGASSGATAIIVAIDTGALTYTLGTIIGTFIVGETVRKTGSSAGSDEMVGITIDDRSGSLPRSSIITATQFSSASFALPITFATKVRITANGGQHRGLVFEFGTSVGGCALWIGDQTIGFHAGLSGTVSGATATYDRGSELPVGWEIDLVACARPGDGKVCLWGNGVELARSQASSLIFAPVEWSRPGAGSFATAKNGTVATDVPAASDQAPAGFEVLAPLSAFVGQQPRRVF